MPAIVVDVRPGRENERALADRIAELERAKNALAAEQAVVIDEFARVHVAGQIASGSVDAEKLERSVSAQVGLACGVSPVEGRRRMRVARDLRDGHSRVAALFAAGLLNEYKVSVIVAATAHLDAAERGEVDRRLAGRQVETLGVRRIQDLARMLAAQVAPEKFAARVRAARTGRRVCVRPAADGMADLIAHLPAEQAVACYAALAKAVNEVAVSPEPVTRGRGQIMADTLVERLTGQATASDVGVQVQIVVPAEALLDPTSPLPAHLPGHGPLPTWLTRRLLGTTAGRATWRRLLTRDGIVIGGDSRQRTFTGFLADLIRHRDGHRCREPFCDAPIRHLDHIRRSSDGGATEFGNGRGLCVFHNHVRETPGWHVETDGDTIVTTTPTGHRYESGIATTTRRQRRPGNVA